MKTDWGRLFFVSLVSALWHVGNACYPGRSQSRSFRMGLRATPLVLKQHYPNAPELSMAASGPSEGRITRKSPRYRTELLSNYNPDIVFKNEEGTMEDRLMTRRCLERLDTLAMLVVNHWPGVKLRVTEAWDEKGFHAPDSLHYEGRAVDLTTSDKDRSKYGMLARLAIRAGFDYVYYESRAHIHASVKSDTAEGRKLRGCFARSTHVTKVDGSTLPMSGLKLGDRILSSADSNGNPVYSPVIMFIHTSHQEETAMLEIETSTGKIVRLTPNHLVYRYSCEFGTQHNSGTNSNHDEGNSNLTNNMNESITDNNSHAHGDYRGVGTNPDSGLPTLIFKSCLTPIFATNLKLDDILPELAITPSSEQPMKFTHGAPHSDALRASKDARISRVTRITRVSERGYIAPLTSHGSVVANGIVTSCYASFAESELVSHASFAPFRVWNFVSRRFETASRFLSESAPSALWAGVNPLRSQDLFKNNCGLERVNGSKNVTGTQTNCSSHQRLMGESRSENSGSWKVPKRWPYSRDDYVHPYVRGLLWVAETILKWEPV